MNVLSSFSGKARLLAVAALLLLALLPLMGDTRAQSGGPAPDGQAPVDLQALQRLLDDSRGKAQVSVSDATQTVNFVRLSSDQDGALFLSGRTPTEKAMAFFESYGGLFGITDPQAQLLLASEHTDSLGFTHLSYQQVYQGVPVWSAILAVCLPGWVGVRRARRSNLLGLPGDSRQ